MISSLRGSISVFMVIFYFINIASAQTNDSMSEISDRNALNLQEKNSQIGGSNSINGHNLSNQNYIRVVLDHIFISKKNNSLEISEMVVFRNEGAEIYYSRDNHTFFAISTPNEVKNLKTQAMECCLVQEEGVVFMDPMQPIKPGDNFEMQVSYTLLSQSKDYVFNKSAVYNTTSLSIFVDKKSGLDLEGQYETLINPSKKDDDRWVYQTLTLQGNEYNVIAFNDLNAGEPVSVPIKMTEGFSYIYAGIGLFSLFSIGLVYRFRDKIFRRREKEYTLEELELEKKKIFQAIYGFEKHAGPKKSEEYGRLIDEYKQKAIQIFIKIDKIKNKGQMNIHKEG
jgi:hypothetical protein